MCIPMMSTGRSGWVLGQERAALAWLGTRTQVSTRSEPRPSPDRDFIADTPKATRNEKTRPTRSRVSMRRRYHVEAPASGTMLSNAALPLWRPTVPTSRIGQLVPQEVVSLQFPPPVAADAIRRVPAQATCRGAVSGIDQPTGTRSLAARSGYARSLSLETTTAASTTPVITSMRRCDATLTSLPFSST